MSTVTVRPIHIFTPASTHARVYEAPKVAVRQQKTWGKKLFQQSPLYHFMHVLSARTE